MKTSAHIGQIQLNQNHKAMSLGDSGGPPWFLSSALQNTKCPLCFAGLASPDHTEPLHSGPCSGAGLSCRSPKKLHACSSACTLYCAQSHPHRSHPHRSTCLLPQCSVFWALHTPSILMKTGSPLPTLMLTLQMAAYYDLHAGDDSIFCPTFLWRCAGIF